MIACDGCGEMKSSFDITLIQPDYYRCYECDEKQQKEFEKLYYPFFEKRKAKANE
jgi:hypothetical protein|tara:strand:+ start:382 stop:546 length:165 start_codon:yes stop_codon:yes gene_type:complete